MLFALLFQGGASNDVPVLCAVPAFCVRRLLQAIEPAILNRIRESEVGRKQQEMWTGHQLSWSLTSKSLAEA